MHSCNIKTQICVTRPRCVNTRDTARYANGYYNISPQFFAEIKCTDGYSVRFSPHCSEEDAEILPIPNLGFSRANSWRQCRWFKNLIRGNIGVLDHVFFTDEAWFQLNGYVNSQNYRTWRTKNPHNCTETPLHPQTIGVWCAISRRRITGPLSF